MSTHLNTQYTIHNTHTPNVLISSSQFSHWISGMSVVDVSSPSSLMAAQIYTVCIGACHVSMKIERAQNRESKLQISEEVAIIFALFGIPR
jgi:hypothetical protein